MKWNKVIVTLFLSTLCAPTHSYGVQAFFAQAAIRVGQIAVKTAQYVGVAAAVSSVGMGASALEKNNLPDLASLTTPFTKEVPAPSDGYTIHIPSIDTLFKKGLSGATYGGKIVWNNSGAILVAGAKLHPYLATACALATIYGTYKIIQGTKLANIVRANAGQQQYNMTDPNIQEQARRARLHWSIAWVARFF